MHWCSSAWSATPYLVLVQGGLLQTATVFAFLVSLTIQVSLPLAVAIGYRRRTRAPWNLFLYGALVFAVFQLFGWLPLNVYLDAAIGAHLGPGVWAFVWLLAMAFMTSLVEEGGRWLGYRILFRHGRYPLNWRNGVMYGLGHGAFETMVFIAGLTFVYMLAYIALGRLGPDTILTSMGGDPSPALREALQSVVATTWPQPLVVALERIIAVPHQVAWALLVMQSLVSRQKRWFGFAVLYHTSVAVIVPGMARLAGFVVAEGANLALAGLSIWIILSLRSASADISALMSTPQGPAHVPPRL
jgi:uncharacterized membrane protein YhfC